MLLVDEMNSLPIITESVEVEANTPRANTARRSVSPINPPRITRLSDTAIPVEHITFQNPVHTATLIQARKPSHVPNGNKRKSRVNMLRRQANRHTFGPMRQHGLPHWQGSRHLIPGPRSVMASRKRAHRVRKTRKHRH